MQIKKFLSDRHILEFLPLVFILSLLPFLHGGESLVAKVIFLAFPLFYLPLLLRRRRKIHQSFRLIFWAWIVFLFINLVSTVLSISLSLSLPHFFELAGVFLYFVFFYLAVEGQSDLKVLSLSIVVVGFILSLISFFFILSPQTWVPGMNLVYASFGHNHLSDYLMYVVPIITVLFLRQNKRYHNLISGVLVAFFFINFYLTFARAAFFIVVLMTVLLVWIYKPPLKKAAFLLFLVLAPFVLALTFSLFSRTQLGGRIVTSTIYQSPWLLKQAIKPIRNEARFSYWKQATEGFSLHPIIGNGPGTFRLTSRRFQQNTNVFSWFAHNSFLQSLSETGAIGFISLAALLFFVIYRIKIPIRKSSYAFALLAGAGGSLLQSLFDFNFDFLTIFLLFWVLIAALLKLSSKPTRRFSFLISRRLLSIASFTCFLFVVSTLLGSLFLFLAKRVELASSERTYALYSLSSIFPSLDNQRFERLLQFPETKQYIQRNKPLENFIVFWNREDPSIHFLLANIHQDREMYERVMVLEPYNRPYIFIVLFRLSLEQGDLQSALTYMEKAARVSIKNKAEAGPIVSLPKPVAIDLLRDNQELSQNYEEFLQTVSTAPSDQPYSPQLAKIFYRLGLLAFQHSEVILTEDLWKVAVALYPEESDFHVELSNFYLQTERMDLAEQQLEYCQKFIYPRGHCRLYQKHNLVPKYYEEVGFLEESIEAL